MIEEILGFVLRNMIYIVMILGFFIIPLISLTIWNMFYRNKTILELCRNIDGRYQVIKSIKISNKLAIYTYNKNDYIIDYKYAVMKNNLLNGHYATFRFDIEDTKPLLTAINEAKLFKTYNPSLLHKIMRTNIYAQILSGVADSQFIIIIMVICALTTVLSGYSVYISIQNQEQIKMLITILTKGVPTK